MLHPEFKYVDFAADGAFNRNRVIELSELPKLVTRDSVDCYTTMFRFREEYKLYVAEKGSVTHAEFPCWCDHVWFDIDNDDLNIAYMHAARLIAGLQRMDIGDKHIVAYFSGKKGFHVGADAVLFDLKPCVELPQQIRQIAFGIAELFHVEIDSIYDINRLWRIPNTVHSATGKLKTKLELKTFYE